MIAGVTLIQRVYERASKSQRAAAVYVATDDDRIFSHVLEFAGKAVRPDGDFRSGTDRIAAALGTIESLEHREFGQVVNVQGDEPLIDVTCVDRIFEVLATTGVHMATLACPIETDEEYYSRDVVKVVTDAEDNALYFSRSAIPYGGRDLARRHVGLYGYQAPVLRALAAMSPTPLERAESLEQLRAIQNGLKIRVLLTNESHLGVDRPEDVLRVESELARHA